MRSEKRFLLDCWLVFGPFADWKLWQWMVLVERIVNGPPRGRPATKLKGGLLGGRRRSGRKRKYDQEWAGALIRTRDYWRAKLEQRWGRRVTNVQAFKQAAVEELGMPLKDARPWAKGKAKRVPDAEKLLRKSP